MTVVKANVTLRVSRASHRLASTPEQRTHAGVVPLQQRELRDGTVYCFDALATCSDVDNSHLERYICTEPYTYLLLLIVGLQ